ncbi:transporter associated domain protein [Haemophilus parahaemolyticus HK385]|nr:transporter associated domain protein [Haemophilus parahaemolyticus HK385]
MWENHANFLTGMIMSDEHQSLSSIEKTEKKNLIQSFLGIFQTEPKNREDLVEVIRDSVENELIDSDTKEMIEGVMEISELRVRDIMIPRPQIISIDSKLPLEACVDIIIESAHSRFPVILDDGKDSIQGILLAKDLLKYLRSDAEEFNMEAILRPAVIVPESKRVDRMLKEFRSERFHMALVVDEFGAMSGLVTIEDILEQIVGDIEDEFDEEEIEPIRQLSRHTYAVSALTDIEKFNAFFATEFTDEEVDTFGGLVMQAFGHLPQRGEQLELEQMNVKVTSADNRRLIQLRVTVSDEQLERMESRQVESEE